MLLIKIKQQDLLRDSKNIFLIQLLILREYIRFA